jgi:hypothetical protein
MYTLRKKGVERNEKLELLLMPIRSVLTISINFNFKHNLNFILFNDPLSRVLVQ